MKEEENMKVEESLKMNMEVLEILYKTIDKRSLEDLRVRIKRAYIAALRGYISRHGELEEYMIHDIQLRFKKLLDRINMFREDMRDELHRFVDDMYLLEGSIRDSEKVGKNSESSPKRSEELKVGMVCDKEFLAKNSKNNP